MAQKFLTIVNGVKTLVELDVSTPKTVGEIFHSAFYTPISPTFPAVCISRLHESDTKTVILDSANLPDLVPALRAEKWKFQNSEDISYDSFTPGLTTEIVLTPANSATVNQPLLELINEMLYYHNSKDRGAALDNTDYSELNLVASFNGVKSKIVGFNAITETLILDYDSSALTTSAGNIQIYPHCIGDTETGFANKAQIRKLREETTLASGFRASGLLENRMHGHKHSNAHSSYGTTPDPIIAVSLMLTTENLGLSGEVQNPISDGVNGTPPIGKTNRSNQSLTKIYIYGGTYAA